MDGQVQGHLFEPFFTTKDRGKGTGLGLATVYGIVKQSGGFIWCDSEPGKGCTFVIHFPASKAAGSTQKPSNEESERLTGTETILLAEDEQMVGNIMNEVLVQAGYSWFEPPAGVKPWNCVGPAGHPCTSFSRMW